MQRPETLHRLHNIEPTKKAILILRKIKQKFMFHKMMTLNVRALIFFFSRAVVLFPHAAQTQIWHVPSSNTSKWIHNSFKVLQKWKKRTHPVGRGKVQVLCLYSLLRSSEWWNQLCKKGQKYCSLTGNFNTKWMVLDHFNWNKPFQKYKILFPYDIEE